MSDENVVVVVEVLDPGAGAFQLAGASAIGPQGSQVEEVAAASYRLTFLSVDTTDLNQTSPRPSFSANLGACVMTVSDGDEYQFALVNSGGVISRNGEAPAAGISMSITDSPLCHAPVAVATP